MKKILLTGSNGQLGRALNSLYKNNGEYVFVNTDVFEAEGITALDITDIEAVMKLVCEVKPYAIVNCAAHTNVNKCETDADNAYRINAIGARNLSIAAKEVGAKMVQVSTDYVFPGTGDRELNEFDPVGSENMYGITKLAGELFVKEFADRYFILRTAWLYGDGNNFVKTMLKLAEDHEEVGVVADQYGTPTSALELARLIWYLIPTGNYGVFHATCEGGCSWADFAEEIFRQAGKNTKVKRLTTEEYPTPAKRPAYSVLDNYMLRLTTDYHFADWKEALKEYMATL